MAKLEDLLKEQGWTDAEIQANASFLNDPRTRTAIEGSFSKMEQTLDTFRTENQRWDDWHKESRDVLALYEKDAVEAKAEAAAMKARYEHAVKAGFAPPVENPPPANQPPASAAFDPKAYGLLTQTDAQAFAVQQGRAMAMYQDIASEHQRLFGKPIEEFSGLYDEFLKRPNKEQSIKDLWASKYNVLARRNEIATEQKRKEEEAIRADERAKVAQQYGNPEARPLMPSQSPFIPRSEGDSKQPWERGTPHQLRNQRLERAMQTQMKGAIN